MLNIRSFALSLFALFFSFPLWAADKRMERIVKELEHSEEVLNTPQKETQSLPTQKEKKALATNADANIDLEQLTVVGDPNAAPEAKEIAKKVNTIQQMTYEFRAKVLKFQDELANRVNDSSQVNLNLEGLANSKKTEGFRELETSLNDIPLIHLKEPLVLEKDARIALFSGPLPMGDYELKIRAVVGSLEHNWPYAVTQGTLLVENSVKFSVAEKGKVINKTITLQNNDGRSQFILTGDKQ